MSDYKIEDLLFEDLIGFNLEAKNYEEVIKKIGQDAYQKGYVKKEFSDAVIAREKLYPTALPTEILKVAIPHPIERDTVLKSAIIVTKLKKPINFVLMGSDDELVPVNIVFTLAINGTENQLTILQKLISLFSVPESMTKINKATSSTEMITILKNLLA